MLFSPYVLLRLPAYNLSNLDAFSIDPEEGLVSEEQIGEKRKLFLSFIRSKDLLISLPLSSHTLNNAIPHYEFHATVKIRKKEKQTERALMKYLCRMSLNASPLAAFAKSQFVNWEWERQAPAHKYHFSLSLDQRKEFFDLCYCDVALQGMMKYRLNPSLHKTALGYAYLYQINKENSMVQLEEDPDFDKAVISLRATDFTFAQFVEISDYDVNDFLEAQLIIPAYPIYGDVETQEKIIKSINERHHLTFRLEDLIGKKVDSLQPNDVLDLQAHWELQVKKFAAILEVGLDNKSRSERLYYLNTYADKQIPKPVDYDKEAIVKELMQLVSIIENVSSVESIRKLKKDNIYSEKESTVLSYDISGITLETESTDTLSLKLDSETGKITIRDFGLMLRHTHSGIKLLNITPAQGKFFSSALELANETVVEDVGLWISQNAQHKVAIKDASLHNKNKGNKFINEMEGFGLDFHHPIADRLHLDYNEKSQEVRSGKGDPIELVNLGIEQVASRSIYYQNLNSVALNLPNIPEFISSLQQKHEYELESNIRIQPSIRSQSLTLGYKKWIIDTKEFIDPFAGSAEENLYALNEWRKKLKIPRLISYSVDDRKPLFHDFMNVWTLHAFLKMVRSMEKICTISDLGIGEEIKGEQIYESYFEVKV